LTAPCAFLGLQWDREQDTIGFNVEEILSRGKLAPATKRMILIISSKLFDPMGLLTPTIVNFKILLQKLWENEAKWDEKVDPKIAKDWEVLLSGLSDLAELKIPRLVPCFSTDAVNYQGELYIFCDASELAYGAVVRTSDQR